MKTRFEQYVHNIVSKTECSQEEKEDMHEELLIHLEISRDELIKEGLNMKTAELKAMEMFGEEGSIGDQIQQSIFPYRKELMITLSIVSVLYSVIVYLFLLFTAGDAFIAWLVFGMLVNVFLLLVAFNQLVPLNRRRWMNGLLLIHILIYLYGYACLSVMDAALFLPMAAWNWLIIFLALLLVYQTTLYQANFRKDLVNEVKTLHRINFVSGILICGLSLFFMWGSMMLFGGLHRSMIVMAVPFGMWLCLYAGQLKLVNRSKKAAFTLAAFSFLLHIGILIQLFFPFY